MSKLDRSEESSMSSSNVNIDTGSKSQNDDDDVVRECPLNGGLKKSKGKRKKSTSLRLKFARKRNDASNPKDLVGLGMYVDFDFNNKNITRITYSYRKKMTQKSTANSITTKIRTSQVHARHMEEGSAGGVSILQIRSQTQQKSGGYAVWIRKSGSYVLHERATSSAVL